MNIAVALSGGVDSACAALLLQDAGHRVTGLHMKLTDKDSDSWDKARAVGDSIGIHVKLLDLSDSFQKHVVDYFVSEYNSGRTPSPCPQCNRKIKMTLLLEQALQLGAERFSTGHYARILSKDDRLSLLKGSDNSRDQSYFLFMLNQKILSNLILPLGELTKVEVRRIAEQRGVPVSSTEDSQELCFIPDNTYVKFLLEQGAEAKPGPIVDEDGNIIGKHRGIIFFTVGQRRGLGVCGPEPLYVLAIDHERNEVIVGKKNQTLVSGIVIDQLSFVSGKTPDWNNRFTIKVRSTSREATCKIREIGPDSLTISFDSPQSGVAPGQAAVLYKENEVVGGGWILRSVKF